jgi:hypothetical protein
MKTNIFPILGLALVLAACKTSPEEKVTVDNDKTTNAETASVIEEIPGVSPSARIFTIPAHEASAIKLPNGGSIVLPENAFVDKNGKPVSGKVDVSWKEYHSLTDIILSGIPMKYDSAGVVHNFESGGMFTIQAKQGENELDLAPSKKAEINLASISDTPCYNFYKIDEKSGDWDYVTTKTGETLSATSDKKSKETTQAQKPDQLLDVTPKNVGEIAALKGKTVVAWKPLAKLSKKEISYLKNKNISTSIKATENPAVYQLETTLANETKTFNVQPYFLEDALKNTEKVSKKQEENFAEILNYQNNVAEGKVLRSIQISNMGTYNWDMIHQMEEPMIVNADFEIPGDKNSRLVSLFWVCPQMNAQIKILPSEWAKFTFDKSKKQCIVGIMPDNSLIALKNSAFDELKKSKGNQAGHTFTLEKTGITLQKGEDMAALIKTLVKE